MFSLLVLSKSVTCKLVELHLKEIKVEKANFLVACSDCGLSSQLAGDDSLKCKCKKSHHRRHKVCVTRSLPPDMTNPS